MNRVSGMQDLFEDAGDYEAFERVLAEGWQWETVEVRGPAPPWPPDVRMRD